MYSSRSPRSTAEIDSLLQSGDHVCHFFRSVADLNELVINAAKYGALSSTRANGSRNLHIKWSESGISSLTIPNNIGLGTQLIAGALQNHTRAFDGHRVHLGSNLGYSFT